jgi:DNA-binding beta-propeller fold protein YncE
VLFAAGCGRTGLQGMANDGGGKRKEGGSGGDAADAEAQPPSGVPDTKNPDEGGVLRLLAGGPGGSGFVDGVGANARFHTPHGMALDRGHLYVSDMYSCTIRKVDIATGEVTTLAGAPEVHGSSDGIGSEARFYFPDGIASDGAGSIFVADTDNNIIRKVDLSTGRVSTLAGAAMQFGSADGTGDKARFYLPSGITSDGAGNLFIADTFNHTVRRVEVVTGKVTTMAGAPEETGNRDGAGAAARFFYPTDIASDGAGNLFIADGHGQTIRKLVLATGEVTTYAGVAERPGNTDGERRAARFDGLHGMVSDGGGSLFVADSENRTIRKIAMATGWVSLFAGSPGKADSDDGTGPAARFRYPYGLVHDQAGNLLVSDADNHAIRKVVIATGEVSTLAGSAEHGGSRDGIGAAARFDRPSGVASDGAGNLLLADSENHAIRKINVATGEVSTLAGSPGQRGSQDGIGSAARFSIPTGVAFDGAGNLLVADSGNRTLRQVVLATGMVTTLAGSPGQQGNLDGRGAAAQFSYPQDVACDGAGLAFVSDSDQHTVRKIVLGTGDVTTLAGLAGQAGSNDGIGSNARFDLPHGMACDRAGNLFVADFGNYNIRKVVIATGQVTTFAGLAQQSGSVDGAWYEALFALPMGLACDGLNLFVADGSNHAVRKIALGTRVVSTVVGTLARPGLRLGPLPAGLSGPTGLALDSTGQLFITIAEENAILAARF